MPHAAGDVGPDLSLSARRTRRAAVLGPRPGPIEGRRRTAEGVGECRAAAEVCKAHGGSPRVGGDDAYGRRRRLAGESVREAGEVRRGAWRPIDLCPHRLPPSADSTHSHRSSDGRAEIAELAQPLRDLLVLIGGHRHRLGPLGDEPRAASRAGPRRAPVRPARLRRSRGSASMSYRASSPRSSSNDVISLCRPLRTPAGEWPGSTARRRSPWPRGATAAPSPHAAPRRGSRPASRRRGRRPPIDQRRREIDVAHRRPPRARDDAGPPDDQRHPHQRLEQRLAVPPEVPRRPPEQPLRVRPGPWRQCPLGPGGDRR